MGLRRISQLAVLSILLTFTNSIAYANPSVPSSVAQLFGRKKDCCKGKDYLKRRWEKGRHSVKDRQKALAAVSFGAVSSSAVVGSKSVSKVLSVSGSEVEISLEERDRLIAEWLKGKRASARKSSHHVYYAN